MLWALCLFNTINANVWILDDNNSIIYDLPSLSSNFGSDIDTDGNTGYLYISKPIEACESILPPNFFNYTKPFINIALIRRSPEVSACPFDHKIYNAQLAKYDAAIVFNNQGDDLLSMQPSGAHPNNEIKIPSVFVGLKSGKILMEFERKNSSFPFKIQLRRDELHGVKIYLIPFVCILIFALSLMLIILILRFIARYRRERANRLPRSALKHIPVKRYTKADGYETCVICLDDYTEGVKIRILFCGHVYHCKCIDPWLLYNKRTCPVCKRKVLRHSDDNSSSASDDDNESETAPLLFNQMSPSNTYSGSSQLDDEIVILTDNGVDNRLVTEPINRVFFVGSVDSNVAQQQYDLPLHRSDDNDENNLLEIEDVHLQQQNYDHHYQSPDDSRLI
ncbi:hypothetical protein GJ496_007766 [Pomphorhynchus laevis]|nr:hypothetical protein GJ496_007766 [Pomphorhynchus laevis]